MKKIVITSLAALMLLGTSTAAFASSDDYYKYRYYKYGSKKCKKSDKRCLRKYRRYRRYRNHEWREHHYGHDDGHYEYYGRRGRYYDD
jgi:hypothetical protein